jgi:nitrile hydratase
MNGVHDMGGMDGFGAVVPEQDEPVFHADWERRLFALSQALPAARARPPTAGRLSAHELL